MLLLTIIGLVLFAGLDTTTLALVGAVAAPLVTWFIAVRRFSGKIETTEAKDLWAESKAIRTWSQARIATLNAQVARLERRVGSLEETNTDLIQENKDLIAMNKQLLEDKARLELKVVELSRA